MVPDVNDFRGTIACELPNAQLYDFQAYLQMNVPEDGLTHLLSRVPLNADNLLLRGATLRNTRAVLGAVLINYAKSLVSEQLPETWLFIQGGLFLLVVTALPDGLVGWWRSGGPGRLISLVAPPPKLSTYPDLDLNPEVKAEQEQLSRNPGEEQS